jgi:hypothetical protein
MSDDNVSPLSAYSATIVTGFAKTTRATFSSVFSGGQVDSVWPENAPIWAIFTSPRRHCHYSLLTFLCKSRATLKNVNNFL